MTGRLVIVPNHVADLINKRIDEVLVDVPDAAPDRNYFYQVLLDHFDKYGEVPEFELEKRQFVAESPDEPTAKNCANWKDGTCEACGVPWQYFEVSADFKCKNFKRRGS